MTCGGEFELDVDSSLMRKNFVNVVGLVDDKPFHCKKEVLIQNKLFFVYSVSYATLFRAASHHTTPHHTTFFPYKVRTFCLMLSSWVKLCHLVTQLHKPKINRFNICL